MRISALSLIIASGGLLQATANPLRVVWIPQEAPASTQSSSNEAVARIHTPNVHMIMNGTHHGCTGARGGRFRQKAAELSNAFRAALGMPLIETHKPHFDSEKHGEEHHKHHKHHDHHHHEKEPSDDELKMEEGGGRVHIYQQHPKVHGHHSKGHLHGKSGREACFFKRLHFALASLSPWEGRAMAFVIGCGLGVLLRMFWVLTVVAFRAIRGDKQESEYLPITNQHDAEEIFVAPPVYIIDEKVAPKEDTNAVPTAN